MHVFEPATILIPYTAPRLDERGAVGLHVSEMPIEAAFGDAEPFAEPIDPKRIGAAVGEHCESGLDPIVHRQPGARTAAARRRHGRQHTAMRTRHY